jgi:large subunit ribosomal protein L21
MQEEESKEETPEDVVVETSEEKAPEKGRGTRKWEELKRKIRAESPTGTLKNSTYKPPKEVPMPEIKEYAVVEASGKQWLVQPNRIYKFDKMPLNPGDTFDLNRVLALSLEGELGVGQPYMDAKVKAVVLGHVEGKPINVFKMKPKKHYRRSYVHVQQYTRVLVTGFEYNGPPLKGKFEDVITGRMFEKA